MLSLGAAIAGALLGGVYHILPKNLILRLAVGLSSATVYLWFTSFSGTLNESESSRFTIPFVLALLVGMFAPDLWHRLRRS